MEAAGILLFVIILIQAECYTDVRNNASDDSWLRLCFPSVLERSANESIERAYLCT